MLDFQKRVWHCLFTKKMIGGINHTLYSKTVPAGVRDFIEMKSGNAPQSPAPRPKKAKPSLPSAVGADTKPEVNSNE